MTQAILALSQIEKAFPGVKALDKASLNVYPGRVMALMGENGAGKSTLMKVLDSTFIAKMRAALSIKANLSVLKAHEIRSWRASALFTKSST